MAALLHSASAAYPLFVSRGFDNLGYCLLQKNVIHHHGITKKKHSACSQSHSAADDICAFMYKRQLGLLAEKV